MLQECKVQQVLILSVARPVSRGPSTPPSPLGANAPNSGTFTAPSDNGELDRVLAEVTSQVAAIPTSWGRLRPEARVFVPSSAQALETDSQIEKEALPANESSTSAEASATSVAVDGG